MTNPSKLSQTCKPCVVQQYIQKPLLTNGHKFDLRLYVLLTSLQPVRAYLYADGLARFAAVPFSSSKAALADKHVHITNVSVQKLHADYQVASAHSAQGSKWSLSALWRHLAQQGHNVQALWQALHDLVAKTLLAAEPEMSFAVRFCSGNN